MSEKIKLYDTGDCVQISHWEGYDKDGFFHSKQSIGLVLESILVEMDTHGAGMGMQEEQEWMYRVVLPDGQITEAWDFEIRPVNVMGKEYNDISHSSQSEK